jgi:hypothetical protein
LSHVLEDSLDDVDSEQCQKTLAVPHDFKVHEVKNIQLEHLIIETAEQNVIEGWVIFKIVFNYLNILVGQDDLWRTTEESDVARALMNLITFNATGN